jgi:small-conductance mechanosensitive channel
MRSILFISIANAMGALWMSPALAQEAPETTEFQALAKATELVRWEGILASLVLILMAIVLLRFVNKFVERLGEMFATQRPLLRKLSAILQFTVYLVLVVSVVLLSFKVHKEVLAVLGGSAAVAIGFAMKDLVASVVAGIMIMFDRPFQLGDRVSFGGYYGDITAIGLRSVKLQTLDDNTVTIPNNQFLSEISSSGNYGALDMQVVIDFHIGLDQDIRLARKLIREAAITSRFVYLPKSISVLINQVIVQDYIALRLRLKSYVLDTKYEKNFESDVTLSVLDSFAEHGIQPPAILHRNAGHLDKTHLSNRDLGLEQEQPQSDAIPA